MADTVAALGLPLKITEGGDFAWSKYMHRSKLSPLETANCGRFFSSVGNRKLAAMKLAWASALVLDIGTE